MIEEEKAKNEKLIEEGRDTYETNEQLSIQVNELMADN
jgi:hypothetical protein